MSSKVGARARGSDVVDELLLIVWVPCSRVPQSLDDSFCEVCGKHL